MTTKITTPTILYFSSLILNYIIIRVSFASCLDDHGRYLPNWDSLDQRPLPKWYDQAKFGIFVHWGLYSVPAYKSEWFWWYWKNPTTPVVAYQNFMETNFKPNFSYADFAPMFTAEFFDANQWANIFAKSGAKYVVLTSKHHEGFTMWPSKYSWLWNSGDTGPHRDIVKELAEAVRQKNLVFGLYYSQFEWFNPLYLRDSTNNFTTRLYPTTVSQPQLMEIVNTYLPEVIWSDGDAGPDFYWNSTQFIAWLYNDSPVKNTVVVNDRWGYGAMCKHGDFLTCADRYSPSELQPRKWENCMTVQRNSWGYDRTAQLDEFLSAKEIVQTLVDTVSYGGNLLLNVGPSHDGRITPIFEERLVQVGQWLKINGESIYKTVPWPTCQNDSTTPLVWYTQSKSGFYATFFDWPTDSYLTLGCPEMLKPSTHVFMLGTTKKLRWKPIPEKTTGIIVDLLPISYLDLPSNIAWTLKFMASSD